MFEKKHTCVWHVKGKKSLNYRQHRTTNMRPHILFYHSRYNEVFIWLTQSLDNTWTRTFPLSRHCEYESPVHLRRICAWNGRVSCIIRPLKPLRHAWHINLIPQSRLQNIYITRMTVDITRLSGLRTVWKKKVYCATDLYVWLCACRTSCWKEVVHSGRDTWNTYVSKTKKHYVEIWIKIDDL